MKKSGYLDTSFCSPSSPWRMANANLSSSSTFETVSTTRVNMMASDLVTQRRSISSEYGGFGGYNRTAMEHVSRSVAQGRGADMDNEGYNIDATEWTPPLVNNSMFVASKRTKRTWDGVFLPVSISIFGVVLFFRLPWIVGECGLGLTLVAIAICFVVTLLATASLAAITTNGFVGDGGPYLMISRCLGPQVGVAVGLALVLANTVAAAMYLGGAVDVVIYSIRNETLIHWLERYTYVVTVVASSVTLLFLLLVSLLKLDKIFRLACLVLTLTALLNFVISAFVRTEPLPLQGFTKVSGHTLRHNWYPDFSTGTNFQKVLYVLFPGVCGLMSGVSGSGELRNGPKAIPKGIMYAWFLALATYLVTAIVVAASFDRSFLKRNYHVLEEASFRPLFLPGEFCASFAAVLSGMVGSSRVLKGIAVDGILPFRFFQWIARRPPWVGVIFFYIFIQLILLLGDTYAYASAFATQVFLVTFVALDLSVFLSSALGITSFRPAFSFFNAVTALTGALAALSVMFFIQPLVASLVLLFMLATLVLVDVYFDPSKVYWGDASQPLMFHFVRKFLLRLDERKEHVRHWRPSIIHIVTDPLCSLNLIHLANNLKKGGLYEVCLVLRGDFDATTKAVFRWKGWLMDFIESSGVKAFPVVMSATELRPAVQSMLRICGLGGMRPNTVLLSMDEYIQRDHFQSIYSAYKRPVPTLREVVHGDVSWKQFQWSMLTGKNSRRLKKLFSRLRGKQREEDEEKKKQKEQEEAVVGQNEEQCENQRKSFSSPAPRTFPSTPDFLPLSPQQKGFKEEEEEGMQQREKEREEEEQQQEEEEEEDRKNGEKERGVKKDLLLPSSPDFRPSSTKRAVKVSFAESNVSFAFGSNSASYRRRGILGDEQSFLPAPSGVSITVPPLDGKAGTNLSNGPAELLEGLAVGSNPPFYPLVLPAEIHNLSNHEENSPDVSIDASNKEDVLDNDIREAPVIPPVEDWGEWLKQSMWGRDCLDMERSSDTHGSATTSFTDTTITSDEVNAVIQTPTSPTTGTGREKRGEEEEEGEGRGSSVIFKGDSTLPRTARAYRTRRRLRWGLFRSGRTDADEDEEQRMLEQVVAHRHKAQINGGIDLATYKDKTEFCCIARDAASAFMNVVIARNMDLLDTDAIESKGKTRKWFIDVWLPLESDATLFLMTHCLRLTSVWKRHAWVRVVSVVNTADDVQQEVRDIRVMLKAHRLAAYPRVVTLEEAINDCDVDGLQEMERRFDDPATRWGVVNQLIRAEVRRSGHRVAIVMMRVPPFAPLVEKLLEPQAETWFGALKALTDGLPPSLLLAGEMMRCRGSDW